MKHTRYDIIYFNGNEEKFYCMGFTEAIILEMSHAIQKGWDKRIKYITNEDGVQIDSIQMPTYLFSK